MVRALVAKKEHKDSLLYFSDADCIYGNPRRNGKSGRCSCSRVGRWSQAVFWMWITALIGSATALLKQHWHSCIRKRPCMAVTGVVRHIISIIFEEKLGKKKNMC